MTALSGRRARTPAVVRVVEVLAWLSAVLTVLGTLVEAATAALGPAVWVPLPVAESWPRLPASASVEGATARVVGGGFTTAEVDVEGLSGVTRALLASGAVVQGGTVVVLLLLVAGLCRRQRLGTLHDGSLSRRLQGAGLLTVVAGVVWQLCLGAGANRAAEEALRIDGAAWDESIVGWEGPGELLGFPAPGFGLQIDFWPIGLGLLLMVLAVVFRKPAGPVP
ncbi:hypothetical protein ACQ7DA_10335 [Zafaria sp. J156]|uniref:hypothetical protein n=1 Tax=Zafaria sp. J156 TaxID=3116490 RepID=UPI002E7AA340|nr:hypothetical protein [Zafaria sp. J156]MEE1621579.1 hypothetical protein [Zafaria sp. J156]